MIAGSAFAVGRAPGGFRRQWFARQDVVEAPTDIALAQLAPGCPPREQIVVVRIERPADVDEALCQDTGKRFSFLRPLADQVRIALLWMNIPFGARDIDVAAQDHAPASGVGFANERLQLTQ